MHEYLLYQRPTCPYCQKVLRFLEQHPIMLPMADTREPGVLDTLLCIGGKAQVPCLVIDGKPCMNPMTSSMI